MYTPTTKIPKDKNALRITDQYRDQARGAMAYEFRVGDARLALLSEERTSTGARAWRFEARTAQSPQLVVIGEWGSSRAEALQTLARLWTDRVPDLGVPDFDWVAIASLLATVRAV